MTTEVKQGVTKFDTGGVAAMPYSWWVRSSDFDRTEAERKQLQDAYDQLTGERFSDRVHVALRDRAHKAEAALTASRAAEGRLRRALEKYADGSYRFTFDHDGKIVRNDVGTEVVACAALSATAESEGI